MRTSFKFIAAFLILSACKKYTHNHEGKDVAPHETHHSQDHKAHGTANAYMHQSNFDELIKRFESPERDAYQNPNAVLDYLGDLSEQRVMDIGAGSGYFSIKLATRGAKVIAADVDDRFLDYIQNRAQQEQLNHIETRKLPYDDPKLNPNEVDMVLVVNTYHHIEDRTDYFKKVKSGIADGGRLVIIDFFKADSPVGPPVNHKISIDRVVEELKKAGFSSFEVEVDLLPYQYIITAH